MAEVGAFVEEVNGYTGLLIFFLISFSASKRQGLQVEEAKIVISCKASLPNMVSFPVKKIVQETAEAITLTLDVPPNTWFYKAGQFITLAVTIEGVRYYRSYSLAPKTSRNSLPAITVKRVVNGRVSNYLHDQVGVGSLLECTAPQGTFTLPDVNSLHGQLVFIAAGSGIVPLFAMIQELLFEFAECKATLIYANRNQASIIYQKQIHQLQTRYSDRLDVIHILSRPQAGWEGATGRLSSPMLLSFLPKEQRSDASYFLCAPEAMMDLVQKTLYMAGVPSGQIHQEHFSLSPASLPLSQELGTRASLVIHQGGEVHRVIVEKGETLLDAALDQGIDIPLSCCSGICNTCRAQCIQGNVHMTEDAGLSEEERAQGYVLTCVGYPASEEVTISLED